MMSLKRLILLLSIVCTSAFIVQAQRVDTDSLMREADIAYPLEYEGVLKTNPLSMLWGSIPLTSEFMGLYEFVTGPQQSSQVGISYIGRSPVLKIFEDTVQYLNLITASGVRLQVSHRWFILSSYDFAPRGLYLSPHFSYATVKVSTKHNSSRDEYVRVIQFNANMLAGWQWISGGDYTMDVFLGLGYKENIWEKHDSQGTVRLETDEFGPYYSAPFKFSIGFHMGIAF